MNAPTTSSLAATGIAALGDALAIGQAMQPAVAIASPGAGAALAVANAAGQLIAASLTLHAHGARTPEQVAADMESAAESVRAGAAAFNAAHPAAAAVVQAAEQAQATQTAQVDPPAPAADPAPTPVPATAAEPAATEATAAGA